MNDTVHFDVPYPDRLNRITTLLRGLTVIPHVIVLGVLFMAELVVAFIAWFAVLFTGRYPRGMWEFSLGVLRYTARLSAYYYLLRDEFPPFGSGGEYPVQYELAYPESMSRLTTFFRGLLIIPHHIIVSVLGAVLGVVALIAWFAILFTGQYPRGLFIFAVGVIRWQQRVLAYQLYLTDAYPPFSMDPGPAPAAGYARGMA